MDTTLKLTSLAFKEGEPLPEKYSYDRGNMSPPLKWTEPPSGTRSLALIVDDPDAPKATPWVHWVIYNLPPTTRELPENVSKEATLMDGVLQGLNDYREIGYGGPQPPSGTHRYFFKLYALDTLLKLPSGVKKQDLEKAMKGHVLSEAQLMGTYTAKTASLRR